MNTGFRTSLSVRLFCATILAALSLVSGASQAQIPTVTEQSQGQQGDMFGGAVALSNNTLVVGAHLANSTTGAAYVYTRAGASWNGSAILAPSDGRSGDQFATSVAINGNTIVVGALQKNSGTGAAYVYTLKGGSWVQTAILAAGDGRPGDYFGVSVAISGNTIVVSAPQNVTGPGAAYVFTLRGTAWHQTAKLVASDGQQGDQFGLSVAIQGNTLLVGAANANNNAGKAYIYTLSHATSHWVQATIFTDPAGQPFDHFGLSTAISGTTLLIGAPSSQYSVLHAPGAVYVYVPFGAGWTQESTLTARDGQPGDAFGQSIAISGSRVAVGAPGSNARTGAVYAYDISGSDYGFLKLFADDGQPPDFFGFSVALSGSALVAGSPYRLMATGAFYATP